MNTTFHSRPAVIIALAMISNFAFAGHHQFKNKLVHVKLGVDIPGYDLNFLGPNESVKFNPNANSLLSVGVSLQEFIGVTWGFRTPQTEEDKVKKGKTDYEDWRLNFAFKHFHIKLNYGRFKGFFVEDSKTVDPSWTSSDPYYQSPNLIFQNAGVNLTWILSPERYSLVAAFDQTERQEKSGGSWLLGAAVNETIFSDEEEIIPDSVQSSFGGHQNVTEGRFQAATLKAGYGYTYCPGKKYFVSGALMAGTGLQQMKVEGLDFSESRIANATKADLLLSIGYNGDDFFSGFFASGDSTKYDTGEIEIETTSWMVRIFLGFRL